MGCPPRQLRVFFFPLMSPGHTLPLVDIAKLFARHDVSVTILVLPSTIPLLHQMIDDGPSPTPIDLISLPPPPGPYNDLTSLPSIAHSTEFFESMNTLSEWLERILRSHRPDCLVSDTFLPWTGDVAAALGIPRIVFHGMGFFPLCALHALGQCESVDDSQLLLPGLPHAIAMRRSQIHDSAKGRNRFGEFMERVVESELLSYGAVVNSFYEMEPAYADFFRTTMGRKAWHVGPVSLANAHFEEVVGRGSRAPSGRALKAWLDSKPPCSVLYVCFGTLAKMTDRQSREVLSALQESNCSFLWIERGDAAEEGVGTREEGKGMFVRGWVPQLLLLGHGAVGGFMTHCGWNSVVESVSFGVPMVTWPMFAEQFYNERLVIDVLRVGVPVGAEEWGMREEDKGVISGSRIREAVARLMDGGEEASALRGRAAELRKKARRAMAVGGSSQADLIRLIDELRNLASVGLNV
ncbi:hypothetical protein HPP92_024721 [Vanilla planifolia]|uniref:Glycosyltransferase n=1 Tax=Vanilla planifolia TaxID=51239 RepID=A0A835PPJ9_VANPL|nr:hypothetical protein HPP92_024721 [Vanilla planifolia]